MANITMLPIEVELGGGIRTINPVAVSYNDEIVLIDCGCAGSSSLIEEKFIENELDINKLTKIIITHHDHDHMGALAELKNKYPKVTIFCSEEQAPYITGREKSLRLKQIEMLNESISQFDRAKNEKLIDSIKSLKKAKEVITVSHGQVIPVCQGIEIVDTKGHMPGHISVYIRSEKVLVTGDALIVKNGKLSLAEETSTLNIDDAKKTLRRLQNYKLDRIICYHGGEYNSNINISISSLID